MPVVMVYILLFVVVGAGFVLINLLVGKLVRPAKMTPEKGTIYECGEPTVGSAWVQFDLRYYVVALLFVIFDVEVAFFFPWATVFGKANGLADPNLPPAARAEMTAALAPAPLPPPPNAPAAEQARYRDLEKSWSDHQAKLARGDEQVVKANRSNALSFAWLAFFDILVFFAVLLVGYAYLWKRGDINWVRSTAAERTRELAPPAGAEQPTPELVGVG